MLLNLSNHPSDKWTLQQLEAAKSYGKIVDIPFPAVDPKAESAEIDLLTDTYFNQIVSLLASGSDLHSAVHIMGELTFCFSLVQKLMTKRIVCLASTTNRLVIEDENLKTTEFQFCRFRAYL